MNGLPILVLNRSWTPIATTTTLRALALAYRGHARIVDVDRYNIYEWEQWINERAMSRDEAHQVSFDASAWIATPTLYIETPRIVTLATYNGVPSPYLAFSRKALFRRDEHTCQYCGVTPGVRKLTIDHVLPRSRDGGTDWHNCVVACTRCNVRKGNRTPEEATMPLARKPFRPSYLEALRVDGAVPEEWQSFVRHVS